MQKSILGILICFSLSQHSNSQSITLSVLDTVLSGQDLFVIKDVPVKVRNSSTSSLKLIVKREIISLAQNHANYFCWGINCYGPSTDQSPDTISLTNGEENDSFKGYLDPGGSAGESKVKYCFIDALNTINQSCFVASYRFGSAASTEPKGRNYSVSIPSIPASYDPITQTIKVNVNGGKIDVMNMLGQNIDLTFRYDGTGMVADASSLKTGYYFLFGTNERGPWSARVIVTK